MFKSKKNNSNGFFHESCPQITNQSMKLHLFFFLPKPDSLRRCWYITWIPSLELINHVLKFNQSHPDMQAGGRARAQIPLWTEICYYVFWNYYKINSHAKLNILRKEKWIGFRIKMAWTQGTQPFDAASHHLVLLVEQILSDKEEFKELFPPPQTKKKKTTQQNKTIYMGPSSQVTNNGRVLRLRERWLGQWWGCQCRRLIRWIKRHRVLINHNSTHSGPWPCFPPNHHLTSPHLTWPDLSSPGEPVCCGASRTFQ